MNVTRRRFAQMVGAVVALIKSPSPAIADALPRLMGDGLRNDAPALNALITGKPIEVGPLVDLTGAGWRGDVLSMPIGRFRLDSPISIMGHKRAVFDFRGAELDCWCGTAITVDDCQDIILQGAHITMLSDDFRFCAVWDRG